MFFVQGTWSGCLRPVRCFSFHWRLKKSIFSTTGDMHGRTHSGVPCHAQKTPLHLPDNQVPFLFLWFYCPAFMGCCRIFNRASCDRQSTRLNSSHVAISYASF